MLKVRPRWGDGVGWGWRKEKTPRVVVYLGELGIKYILQGEFLNGRTNSWISALDVLRGPKAIIIARRNPKRLGVAVVMKDKK